MPLLRDPSIDPRLLSPAPADPLAAVRREVRPGERALWSSLAGEAGMRRRVQSMTRFGRLFGGFAIVWVTGAGISGLLSGPAKTEGVNKPASPAGRIGFPLFGVPLVLVGVWMMRAGDREARRAARTAYLVTDRRAVVLEVDRRGRVDVTSFGPEDLGRVDKVRMPDGSGDLAFSTAAPAKRKARWQANDVDIYTTGFYGVPDVDRVQLLLEQVREDGQKAGDRTTPGTADRPSLT